MKTKDTIHIAFAINDQFAIHLGAAIASLLTNAKSKNRINIYVLQQNLNHSNRSNITQLKRLRTNTYIDLLEVDSSKFALLPLTSKAQTIETYFRLALPNILPEIDKLIYLDADVVVMGDIKELWNQEMKDNILLAVEDPKYTSKNRHESLGMKMNSPYFNGGVLMMDLKKMRAFGLEQKVPNYVRKKFKILKYQDQDILNALFENYWRALPLSFNAYKHLCFKHGEDEFFTYTQKDILLAKKNPYIIHFNGTIKPSSYSCTDTRRKHYLKYLKKTNFEVDKPSFEMRLKIFLWRKMSFIINNDFFKKTRLLAITWEILWWPIRKLRGKKAE